MGKYARNLKEKIKANDGCLPRLGEMRHIVKVFEWMKEYDK